MNQPRSEQEAYEELSYYTLEHTDPSFIHQHIVDAYAVQRADTQTKPIAIAFGLVGLYLYLEKGFTGKQVQQFHMHMARQKREWPLFDLPINRGNITVFDILSVPQGTKRDEMIRAWCVSIWEACQITHKKVAEFYLQFV